MKLFLILIAAAAACYFGYGAFRKMTTPRGDEINAKLAANHAARESEDGVLPSLPPSGQFPSGKSSVAPDVPENLPAPQVESVLVYIFRNRPVPPPPFERHATTGSGKDAKGLELSLDQGSNAWIMRGPPESVRQTEKIAQFLDVVQTEIDLDFLLCAVSESWLRAAGLTAVYQQGASWLSAFSLGDNGATLRLESNGLAVDLTLEDSDSSARLVSAPVVRCVTGEPWEFSADQQVPIESVQRSEGVVSTAYQYQQVGLGFSGVIQKAGPDNSFRLALTQRNGTADEPKAENRPPALRTQTLKTSLVVEVGRWSCVGGVGSWRTAKKKRLLGFSESEEQDLLLIFVRPRDALQVAPRALPVGDGPEHLDDWGFDISGLPADVHPLLPPKRGWAKGERDFIRAKAAK